MTTIRLHDWLLFAGAALLMALTPGPNMVYLISRSVCQIVLSFSVGLAVACSAAGRAAWLAHRPTWLSAQRYMMGTVLAGLALRLATEPRRAA